MGKASSRKRFYRDSTGVLSLREGEFTVSFVFDGKLHTKTHQLTAFEIRHMKDLCTQHGDQAAEQLIWKTAVKGIGMVAENMLAKAALEFIKKNWKGLEQVGLEQGKLVCSYKEAKEIMDEVENAQYEEQPDGTITPVDPIDIERCK